MFPTSVSPVGTFFRFTFPESASNVAARRASTAFLDPLTSTNPLSLFPPRTTIASPDPRRDSPSVASWRPRRSDPWLTMRSGGFLSLSPPLRVLRSSPVATLALAHCPLALDTTTAGLLLVPHPPSAPRSQG